MGFQVCKDAGPVARIFRLSPESTTNSFWRMGARPGATVRRAAAMAWAAALLAASLTWGASDVAAQQYPGGYGPGMRANPYGGQGGGQYAGQYAPGPHATGAQTQYAQPLRSEER